MQFFIDMMDRWQRTATVELTLRSETVEIRCREKLYGVVDREELGFWIRSPEGAYSFDDVTLLAAGDGVALALEDVVPAWVLDDQCLRTLRVQL